MREWKRHLAGFTGLYVVLSIWMPVFWFVSWARNTFNQDTFSLFDLPPYALVFGALIIVCAFAATMGLAFAVDWPNDEKS